MAESGGPETRVPGRLHEKRLTRRREDAKKKSQNQRQRQRQKYDSESQFHDTRYDSENQFHNTVSFRFGGNGVSKLRGFAASREKSCDFRIL